MKKVGLMIYSIPKGGAERVVSILSEALTKEYEVFLLLMDTQTMAYDVKGTLIDLSIPHRTGLIGKTLNVFKHRRLIKKAKKAHQLDIVISFLDIPNLFNLFSATPECATVISIRNYQVTSSKGGFYTMVLSALCTLFYPLADTVIAVSRVIAQHTLSTSALDPKKLVVIANPYRMAWILHQASLRPQPSLDFDQDSVVFCSVGRMQKQKGTWHLIKAFKIVHDRHPKTRLILIGQDHSQGKISALIEALDLQDVIDRPGLIDNPFALVARSDVYVLSSLSEGFPNAMVEAMVCSTPIIAADCRSGPREILSPESPIDHVCSGIEKAAYGILSMPFTQDENWDPRVFEEPDHHLANAMLELAEDEDLRAHYASAARGRAADFSVEASTNAYRAVIEALTTPVGGTYD